MTPTVSVYHAADPGPDGLCRVAGCGRPVAPHIPPDTAWQDHSDRAFAIGADPFAVPILPRDDVEKRFDDRKVDKFPRWIERASRR